MGAHHAPAHVARRTRPAHASSTTTGPRLGRLAGRGALTASAALVMTGAGAGAALAHDAQPVKGLLSDDSSLLCGILGGDRCSSDTQSSSDTDDDTSRSVFDRLEERNDAARDESVGERSSRAADTTDDSSARSSSARGDDGASRPAASQQQDAPQRTPQQQSARQQGSQLDTPPPPGEVRAINLPN